MRADVLLCDHAEVAEGKLFINGAGWTTVPAAGSPTSLAIIVHVPWTETNRKRKLTVALLDTDEVPATQPTPVGEAPVRFEADFEVGRPAGTLPGNEIPVPIAINFQPLPLKAGGSYYWRVTVDESEVGRASFRVREA